MAGLEQQKYDVVIVGSGPSGISTAIRLASLEPSMRDRVLVLEKTIHPRKKLCGGAISTYAEQWLERLGIRISINSLEPSRVRYVIDQGEYMEYDVVLGAGFRMVLREEFDYALVKEAVRLGVRLAEAEPAISFSYEDGGIAVHTPKRVIMTRILVGADGSKSIVRPLLYQKGGIKRTRNLCIALRYLCRVYRTKNPEHVKNEAIIDFSSTLSRGIGGYLWSSPVMFNGETWLNTGIVSFHRAGPKVLSLREVLAGFLGKKGFSIDKSGFESHPIRWFHPSSEFSGERTVLVGDAAGVDPFWGEGISFSLGYGDVAAGSILHALESRDFSFKDYKRKLLNHEIGQILMERLRLADDIYKLQKNRNYKTVLRSFLLKGHESSSSTESAQGVG